MRKILIMTLVALVATMGTVSAYDASIWNQDGTAAAPASLQIKPGDSLILSYHMENLSQAQIGESLNYSYYVVPLGGGASASDVTVTIPATVTPTAVSYTDVGAIKINLNAAAPVGAKYRVTIAGGDIEIPIEFGAASRTLESIPEFPTVALPVAAILGLAFVFMRKKD